LAIYHKVEWLWSPFLLNSEWLLLLSQLQRILTVDSGVIDRQAMNDLKQDSLDLLDLISDQVRKLGPRSRTKRAIAIFGLIGHATNIFQFSSAESSALNQARNTRKQRSLVWLLLDSTGSFLESAVSSLMIWSFALLRWGWKTCTANGLILSLLFSSLLINGFYSSRDTYDWWHERNAAKFLSRLGIHSDHVMSKAVFVHDLDQAMLNTTTGWHPNDNSSSSSHCFATFHEQTLLDSGTSLVLQKVTPSQSDDILEKSAARRVQRTRQRLGMYRHDLLVAMRVLNSIEKEVLRSEWERWLGKETERCEQIATLLHADAGEFDLNTNAFAGREEDVKHWYEQYCMSCQEELQRWNSNKA
jgi:hypothetical protein